MLSRCVPQSTLLKAYNHLAAAYVTGNYGYRIDLDEAESLYHLTLQQDEHNEIAKQGLQFIMGKRHEMNTSNRLG